MLKYVFWYENHLKPYLSIAEDEVFLDVGANIGCYTKLVAPKCKKVYAWEPNPRTAQELRKNTKKHKNVVIFIEGLGAKDGELPFYLYRESRFDGFIPLIHFPHVFSTKTIKCPVKPLDSYNFDDEKIGLIKIDTEGFEVPIIKGALKTIRKHRPRLILEIHGLIEENTKEIMCMLPFYKWRKTRRGNYLIGDSN